MLNSLTCTNFKKLREHTFTFSEDLNIICGDNTAGKTTLTQAIAFALFGVKAIPGDSKKIPTWGEKNCQVVLQMDGYVIDRTLTNCKIYKGSVDKKNLEATGNSVCAKYVEDNITGVDLKGFKMLNWSPQGETGALLTLGAAQLQRDVEKFSGVDFLDKIIKMAGEDMRDLQRDVTVFESKGSVKKLKRKIGAMESDLDACLRDKAEMEANGVVIGEALEEANASLAQSEANDRKFRQSETAMATLRSQISGYDEQRAEAKKDMDGVSAELDTVQIVFPDDYETAKAKLDADISTNLKVELKRDEATRLNGQLEGIEDDIARDQELTDILRKEEARSKEAKSAHVEAVRQLKEAAAEVARLNKAIDSGVCSECGQLIADEETLHQYKVDLHLADAALIDARNSEEAAKKADDSASFAFNIADEAHDNIFGDHARRRDRIMDERNAVNAFLADHDFDDSVDARREELEGQLADLTKREQLESQLSKLESRRKEWKEDINAWKTELKKLEAELPSAVSEQELTELKDKCAIHRANLQENRELVHELELKITGYHGELGDLQYALQLEEANREKLSEIKSLKDFTQFLQESRVTFLSQIWGNILAVASGFLMRATNGVVTALTKSDKEGFMFCEEGVYAPVASASGAQKGFIGVAVRIGLAKSLRGSSEVLVLDEPTESMREDNALRLSGSLLGQGQILMVTHRESDKVSASNVIEV